MSGEDAISRNGTGLTPEVTTDALVVPGDRLAIPDPAGPHRRRSGGLLPIAIVSLAAHVALLGLFLRPADTSPAAERQETAVEIVQEPAAKPKKEAAKAEPQPKPEAKDDKQEQQSEAKANPPPPPPKTPEPATPETEQASLPQSQPQPQPQPPPVRSAPPLPAEQAAKPPTPDQAAKVQALQEELAALKTQQAKLEADALAQAQAAAAEETKALGLLPDSFSAVALPSVAANGEDAVTYQQAVYSLILKAKKSGQHYMPGVAHVVFDLDASGKLVDVRLDHSSGNADVDAEALALVRRAGPFPPPPDGAPHSFPAYMSFVADD